MHYIVAMRLKPEELILPAAPKPVPTFQHIKTLEDLRLLYHRGQEAAFQRWANLQDLNSLINFCQVNQVNIVGRQTPEKILGIVRTLLLVF